MTSEDFLEIASLVEQSTGRLSQDGETFMTIFNPNILVALLRERAKTAAISVPLPPSVILASPNGRG